MRVRKRKKRMSIFRGSRGIMYLVIKTLRIEVYKVESQIDTHECIKNYGSALIDLFSPR